MKNAHIKFKKFKLYRQIDDQNKKKTRVHKQRKKKKVIKSQLEYIQSLIRVKIQKKKKKNGPKT